MVPDSGGPFEIICKRCGQHNEDGGAFCGGCGTFLEWDGERISSAGAVPAATVADPAASSGSGAVPASSLADPAARGGPGAGQPPAASRAAPFRSPTDPPDAGSGRASQPTAVKPAVPVSKPAPLAERAPARPSNPGDLICGNCGESNEPTRKFCHRCGTTLSAAAVVAAVPWWRRIFARAPKAPVPAGTRPTTTPGRQGSRRLGSAVVKALALAVAVAIVAFAAIPSLRQRATNEATTIRRSIRPNYPTMALEAVTASGVGGCPAPRLKDNSTVYWDTHPPAGAPQVLTITVAASFKGNLDKVGITPLAPDPASASAGGALPYPLQLRLLAGAPQPATLVLANPPQFRSFTAKASHPRSIQLTALSTDPGAAASSCAETAFIFYDRT